MMNKLLLVIMMAIFSISATGQSEIYTALSKGDVNALQTHLDSKVELCIFNKEDVFDRPDAVVLLKEFFGKHKVQGFKQMHSGASKGLESNYAIGQLTTDKGTFRVYMYFDTRNDKRTIQELRIEHNR